MPTIELITTGTAEFLGLAVALRRAFPMAEFRARPPADSFTSSRVVRQPLGARPVRTKAEELAARLVAAVDPGREVKASDRPDFAIAVDDLELANWDQPEIVVEVFREAVQSAIASMWANQPRRDRTKEMAAERCSFHLFVPMLEAYFYRDPSALIRAGARSRPRLAPDTDIEYFTCVDEEYLAGISTQSPEDRLKFARHPKHYLKHLRGDAVRGYRDSKDAVAALVEIDWALVLSEPRHACFLRSLFEDISRMTGSPIPYPGILNPLTARFDHRANVIRNL